MKIDLTDLLREVGKEADIDETLKLAFPEDHLNFTRPVRVKMRFVNTGASVLAKGSAETEVELECSRCLKTYKSPLSVRVEETYSRRPPEGKARGENELKEEDFVYSIEKDNTIDIAEVIRQNILLAIPIKTLCKPDCQGIKGE